MRGNKFYLLIMLVEAWLLLRAIQYLIQITEKKWKRLLLLVSSAGLLAMVIFIGDKIIVLFTAILFLGAFENCTALREVFLPEGITEIPERAFFRCHSLREIHLPSTLRHIGKEAFAFCKNLQKPVVAEEVIVAERAFAGTK